MTQWCIARWSEGLTTAVLQLRGERGGVIERAEKTCPTTGVFFNGPLAELDRKFEELEISAVLGVYGFPHGGIGNVKIFESEKEAQKEIDSGACGNQSWIKIDKPCPSDALSFYVETYRYYDGVTTKIPMNSLRSARAAALLREDNGTKIDIKINCNPIWDVIDPYKPTIIEVQKMWNLSNANLFDDERKKLDETPLGRIMLGI